MTNDPVQLLLDELKKNTAALEKARPGLDAGRVPQPLGVSPPSVPASLEPRRFDYSVPPELAAPRHTPYALAPEDARAAAEPYKVGRPGAGNVAPDVYKMKGQSAPYNPYELAAGGPMAPVVETLKEIADDLVPLAAAPMFRQPEKAGDTSAPLGLGEGEFSPLIDTLSELAAKMPAPAAGPEETGPLRVEGDKGKPYELDKGELSKFVAALAEFAEKIPVIGKAAEDFKAGEAAVKGVIESLKKGDYKGALEAGVGGLGMVRRGLSTQFAAASKAFGVGKKIGGAVLGVGRKAAGAARGGTGAAMSALTASTTGVIDAFKSVVAQIQAFVGAANPALLERFNQVIEDNMATVGIALEPLMTAATALAHEFGSMLMPVMQQLRPIVQQVADTFMKLAGPYFGYLSTVMGVFLKALQPVVDLFDALSPILQTYYVLISGAIETVSALATAFGEMIGLDLKGIFTKLKEAVQQVATTLIVTIAKVVSAVSSVAGRGFRKGVANALGGYKKQDNRGAAAAKNVQIGGFQAISQALMRSSLRAGPGGDEKSAEDKFRENLLKQIEELNESTEKGWVEKIEDRFKKVVELLGKIAGVKEQADLLKDQAVRAGRIGLDPTGAVIGAGRRLFGG